MAFLKSLPLVAWIASLRDGRYLGSIVDIFHAEILAVASMGRSNLAEIAISVRKSLLKFGPPSQIATFEFWEHMRPAFIAKATREQEIASLLHLKNEGNDNTEIALLNKLIIAKPSTDSLEDLSKKVAIELAAHGDRRLTNSARTAKAFVDDVSRGLDNIFSSPSTLAEAFANQFGVPIADITPSMTLGEFKEIARRRNILNSAVQYLDLELDLIWPTVRDAELPSEIVVSAIRSARKNAIRASGSDLTDDYLACISPYVDAVIVDKRTHEHLTQAMRRNSKLGKIAPRIEKVSSYADLSRIFGSNTHSV